jgi:hypothetical protein
MKRFFSQACVTLAALCLAGTATFDSFANDRKPAGAVRKPSVVNRHLVKQPTTARSSVTQSSQRTAERRSQTTTHLPSEVAAARRGAAINTGRLNDLKTRIDGMPSVAGGSSGVRASLEKVDVRFGAGGGSQAGSALDGMRSSAGGNSKNPLENQSLRGRIATLPGQAASDNPSAASAVDKALRDRSADARRSLGTTMTHNRNAPAGLGVCVDKPTSVTAEQAIMLQVHLGPSSPSGGSQSRKYNEMQAGVINNFRGEPTPDGESGSSPRSITKDVVKGINARRGSHTNPNPEAPSGSGGPIDGSRTAAGRVATQSTPADGQQQSQSAAHSALQKKQIEALRARLINPVPR